MPVGERVPPHTHILRATLTLLAVRMCTRAGPLDSPPAGTAPQGSEAAAPGAPAQAGEGGDPLDDVGWVGTGVWCVCGGCMVRRWSVVGGSLAWPLEARSAPSAAACSSAAVRALMLAPTWWRPLCDIWRTWRHVACGARRWVREEIHRWVFNNVRAKWAAVRRRPAKLCDLFSGYHASRHLVREVIITWSSFPVSHYHDGPCSQPYCACASAHTHAGACAGAWPRGPVGACPAQQRARGGGSRVRMDRG